MLSCDTSCLYSIVSPLVYNPLCNFLIQVKQFKNSEYYIFNVIILPVFEGKCYYILYIHV